MNCDACGYRVGHDPTCLVGWGQRNKPKDIDQARDERDQGIDRAENNADLTWLAKAEAAVIGLAQVREFLTADLVWPVCGPTKEPRALAGVLRRLQGKVIEPTGTYAQSTRRHASPVRVWRSLVYRAATGTGP